MGVHKSLQQQEVIPSTYEKINLRVKCFCYSCGGFHLWKMSTPQEKATSDSGTKEGRTSVNSWLSFGVDREASEESIVTASFHMC